MSDYEQLLEQAYKKIKVISAKSDRFELPKVQGQVEGKNTIITNIKEIADYIRRPIDQLARFLSKELAAQAKIKNERLIFNTKLNSAKVNEKLELYVKDFVICNECKKPDTEIISEKGIKLKHCLACGAKSPIRSRI